MGLDQYLYAEVKAPVGSELFKAIEGALSPKQIEYLEADRELYVGGWTWAGKEETDLYEVLVSTAGFTPNPDSPHFELFPAEDGGFRVRGVVYYWRKTNSVHNFFVNNAQGGKDECQYTEVPAGLLEDLIARAAAITEDHSLTDLLESRGGFFFGSTDYDEWYFEDMEKTARDLPVWIDKAPEGATFGYQSSW